MEFHFNTQQYTNTGLYSNIDLRTMHVYVYAAPIYYWVLLPLLQLMFVSAHEITANILQ